jgi:hypothetical protein
MSGDQGERLNSWKAIARHLGRDVRTVKRWDHKGVGMPVHRVPGGRSVFAYARELDAWLLEGTETEPANGPFTLRRFLAVAGATAAVMLVVSVAGNVGAADSLGRVVTVTSERDHLAARDEEGEVLWTYQDPSRRVFNPPVLTLPEVNAWPAGGESLIVAHNTLTADGHSPHVGQVMHLSSSGELRWARSVNESLRFGGKEYSGAWASALLYAPSDGSDVIIWGAHDSTWWPSVTLALSEDGSVVGKFVNSGWVTSAGTLPPSMGDQQLLLGGISNSRAGAMLALLPSPHFFGTSPEEEGSSFACTNCPEGRPLRYLVFQPTHVNSASGLPYNRTTDIEVSTAGVMVMVREGSIETDIQWIYEFTLDLDLIRARPSDSYWPAHERLEKEGRLDHTVGECAERGSVEVLVWTRESGWDRVRTPVTE